MADMTAILQFSIGTVAIKLAIYQELLAETGGLINMSRTITTKKVS